MNVRVTPVTPEGRTILHHGVVRARIVKSAYGMILLLRGKDDEVRPPVDLSTISQVEIDDAGGIGE